MSEEHPPEGAEACNRLMGAAAQAVGVGDVQGALTLVERALALQPDNAGILACQANLLAATGRDLAALEALDRALAIEPGQFGACLLRATLQGRLSRHQEALADFGQILSIDPGSVDALAGAATALQALRRPAEALDLLNRLLAIDPDAVEGWHRRGQVLSMLQRTAEALSAFEQVLRRVPRHAPALRDLGIALYNLGRYAEAAGRLDAALALDERDVAALIARGLAAGQDARHEEALGYFDKALVVDPGNVEARIERAVALGRLQRPREALDGLDRIERQAVEANVDWLNARGASLALLNRLPEALACYDRSLSLQPDQAFTRSDRALVLLALGDYPRGFREFEVRWRIPPLSGLRLATPAPLWTGTTSLEGRTILLHHEQGFGDTIQFVRYVPAVAELGARVILRVPAPLQRLLAELPGVGQLIDEASMLPPHDAHCPLMSLPVALATTLTTVPATFPYLHAATADVERWGSRLAPWTRPRIGIAWAGRAGASIADRRDLPRVPLQGLLRAARDLGVQVVSLQRDGSAADPEALASAEGVVDFTAELADFADTAALMMNLDRVIAVDTAVAHLAGALGRPLWLLNRHAPCWRWCNGSPWYPSVRQFVQPSPGDWTSVIEAVASAMAGWVARWRTLGAAGH